MGKSLVIDHMATAHGIAAVSATASVNIVQGIILLTHASVSIALTIPTPSAGRDDGKILYIINTGDGATAPQATVLCANKIWDGTTGVNGTLTLTAFPGSSATLIAYQGFWYTLSLNNAPAT
jgi:hypothetical protein